MPRTDGPNQIVRVAVVQLSYHPAFTVEGRSLLSEPFGSSVGEALLPLGVSPDLQQALSGLRERIRDAYLEQLKLKVKAILRWCSERAVELVVFPEYSLPAALLQDVADTAGSMVVLAGSHFVDRDSLSSGVYQRLGAAAPELQNAVCPIVHLGQLVKLVTKLHPSPIGGEQHALKPGTDWSPISLAGLPGPLGVLLCIDFIDTQNPRVQDLTMRARESVKYWAIPSLSHSTRDFYDEAHKQAVRSKQPVLYANRADAGKSAVFVDFGNGKGPSSPLPRELSSGEEGLIVGDLNLAERPMGGSTSFGDTAELFRVVAVPSLVYCAIEADGRYARWQSELVAALKEHTSDAFGALKAAGEKIEALSSLFNPSMPATRRRRLSYLVGTAKTLQSIEELQRLTDEIILESNLLPLEAVEAELSMGVAAVLRSWRDRAGLSVSELAASEQVFLRSGVQTRQTARHTPEGQDGLRKIEARICDGVPAFGQLDVLIRQSGYYARETQRLAGKGGDEATALLKNGRYDEARALLTTLLEQALEALGVDSSLDARQRVASVRLLLANTLLNLQQLDDARNQALAIEPTALDVVSRLQLVRLRAEVGQIDEADELLTDLRKEKQEDARGAKFVQAEQLISLSRGILPRELSADPSILLKAAHLELRYGRLPSAIGIALRAREDDGPPLVRAIVLMVLMSAMGQSILEIPGVEPLPVSERKRIIEAIDHLHARLLPSASLIPADVAKRLAVLRSEYFLSIHDLDLLEQEPEEPADAIISVRFARARSGDLRGALATLDGNDMPWVQGINEARLVVASGDKLRALDQLVQLAQRYPSIGPVHLQLALTSVEAGRHDQSVAHAKQAYQLVPSRGYRLVLAYCLMGASRPNEAWELLEEDRDVSAPRIVGTLAKLADAIHPNEAPELWRRYGELRADGHALVAEAQALLRLQQRERAAERAWEAFAQYGDDLEQGALFACGQLQSFGSRTILVRDRIRQVMRKLDERFPEDPEAQNYRLTLHFDLGPDNDTPIDFARLEKLGVVKSLPVTDVLADLPEAVQGGRERSDLLWQWYESGALTLKNLAKAHSLTLAEVAWAVLNSDRRVCAPVRLDSSRIEGLLGCELILGHSELLILAFLNLLEPLRTALRRHGARILLHTSHDRDLRREALELRTRGDRLDDVAESVCDFVAMGTAEGEDWLQLLEWNESHDGLDGELPSIPAVGTSELPEAITREPLQECVNLAASVLAKPNRWRVTVDLFGSWGIPDPCLARTLAWTGPRQFRRIAEFLHRAHRRQLSIPDLVRWILPQTTLNQVRREECLKRLARQGFPDAINATELLNFARDAPDLSSIQDVLHGLERLAMSKQQPVGAPARFKLCLMYADAFVAAFLGQHRTEIESETTVRLPDVALPGERGDVSARQSHRLPLHQARIFGTALLARAEELTGSDAAMLDTVLSQIANRAVLHVEQAVLPLQKDSRLFEMSQSSLAGQMWTHIGAWAGGDGSRRTALTRALRDAWCLLDTIEDGTAGPPKVRLLPLLLAGRAGQSTGEDEGHRTTNVARITENEPVAILSANWEERPLDIDGLWFETNGSAKKQVDWESILQQGAQDLAQLGGEAGERVSERMFEVWYTLSSHARFRAWVPTEAALLRIPAESSAAAMTLVKRLQGGLDGHAYNLLEALEASPADAALRRKYARHSVGALWRAVQEDPAYLVRWPSRQPISEEESAPSLAALCEILHEPALAIGTTPHLEVIRNRMETWKHRDPFVAGALLLQITEAPGAAAALPLTYGIALREPEHEVEMALQRIEQPDVHPAGALARDVMLLRWAAARQPILGLKRGRVDLREILPEHFERLLESVVPKARGGDGVQGRAQPGTMAQHEPDLLRACAGVVGNLVAGSSERTGWDCLWLTYRLHSWLARQLASLDPEARRVGISRLAAAAPLPRLRNDFRSNVSGDLFNPFFFQIRGFDYRLAVVLFALSAMEELTTREPQDSATKDDRPSTDGATSPRKISSPGLERRLLALARDVAPGPVDERPFVQTWLAWGAPDNVPDLAMGALLRIDPGRVRELGDEALVKRINAWPSDLSQVDPAQAAIVDDLARILGLLASTLSRPVREALEMRLLLLGDGERESQLKWLGLAGLFAAGAPHLEERLKPLVERYLEANDAVFAVSRYFQGLATIDGKRLADEVFRLYETWKDRLERAIEVLSGALGVLIVHGAEPLRTDATRLLLLLAEKPAARVHGHLRALLEHLRLDRVGHGR